MPDDASLVCLVGANGTGKTHILELISACAHLIGLSPGIEIPRGNPFADQVRDFSTELFLARGVSDALDETFAEPEIYQSWDRTIHLDGQSQRVLAGGILDEKQAHKFANEVVNRLRASKEVHHLTLDADRAFPKRDLPTHEMAQAFEQHWHDREWQKGRAYQTTRTLYDEWIKYCLARENKAANEFYQAARRAAETGKRGPNFSDAFQSYRASLRHVMPHLLFAGADQERKAVLFDTAGLELRFDQLSGGEREIAFLVGQIDRFGLRNGIFLLDEPELHLNPDLVRNWVSYLAKTVATGQVWLATHSIEAVEAAGLSSTILLERDATAKLVNQVSSLSNQPVLSALSRAVGTPAFSIAGLRFVFIEGEEAIGERERFRRLTALDADTRFIECGSCAEVVRRVAAIQSLAHEANQNIRIAGIIDRDWRTVSQLDEMDKQAGLFVLPVHEVENFFLEKQSLLGISAQNGKEDFDYKASMQQACDNRAGGWILQHAISDPKHADISAIHTDAKSLSYSLSWGDIASDIPASMATIANRAGLDKDGTEKLKKRLVTFANIYQRKRETDELWKICEGKEILKVIARELGFIDHQALERSVTTFWEAHPEILPDSVKHLREVLSAI